MTDSVDRRLLAIYLNDHVTGATAALARLRRMADTYRELPIGPIYQDLARKIDQERTWLFDLMADLGLPLRRYKLGGAVLAERVGRLKLNGHLVRPSRLSPLLETEILRSAITGKQSGWRTLEVLGEGAGISPARLERLAQLQEEASEQLSRVDAALEWLRPRALVEP